MLKAGFEVGRARGGAQAGGVLAEAETALWPVVTWEAGKELEEAPGGCSAKGRNCRWMR
jgi:hypothetical protein